jgi:hypothetical protein
LTLQICEKILLFTPLFLLIVELYTSPGPSDEKVLTVF